MQIIKSPVPSDLSQELLRRLYDYHPDGYLVHRETANAGLRAGWIDESKKGYWFVKVAGKKRRLHRLIWLWHYGVMPENIDHKDRDKNNNRIENLRECDKSHHAHNKVYVDRFIEGRMRGTYKSGNRFAAQICKDYKTYQLGSYSTEAEAHAAYCGAAVVLYGEGACTE